MIGKKRNKKWRADVDGRTWLFIWRTADNSLLGRIKGSRKIKPFTLTSTELVDALVGQRRLL